VTSPFMPVLWQGAAQLAVLSNTFEVAGVPTDPDTVTCVVTDPNGNSTTYTYRGSPPGDIITRESPGSYQLAVPCVTGPGSAQTGIFAYAWVGTGAASNIAPGTFTVNPTNLWQYYASTEELKYRLGIKDSNDDVTVVRAIRAATRWVEGHCHRHFYQMRDVRTYAPYSLAELPVDDIVSITALAVDTTGDGIFDQPWTQGTDYELATGPRDFNQFTTGEPRPYTLIRVINSGVMFPTTWPFSRMDCIQITGIFGWPAVPDTVADATLQVATDIYKRKDAPFGLAGVAPGGGGSSFDFGTVRVPRINPSVIAQLTRYVRPRKVGI
jgi:hypothetical protein